RDGHAHSRTSGKDHRRSTKFSSLTRAARERHSQRYYRGDRFIAESKARDKESAATRTQRRRHVRLDSLQKFVKGNSLFRNCHPSLRRDAVPKTIVDSAERGICCFCAPRKADPPRSKRPSRTPIRFEAARGITVF